MITRPFKRGGPVSVSARALAVSFLVALALMGPPLGRGRAGAAGAVRLAVMEFGTAGAGPDLDGMGVGLQSMITTDLTNVSTLVLVERARLHDVVAELKLGRSKLVDASTAAKVGKVVGATHLLTGTVTLAGGKMRLDARLVEVGTGRVLLGESIDGQADVFFELEKSLVRKLVDAVAVQMTPKERGALAKIQTADFEAFRRYSAGLKLFDDKKYDEALKALREASERDADFSLARTTLAEYERIAASLRREADGLEQQRTAAAERKLNQEMLAEQKLIGRLFDAAGRKGDAARDTRLTALYLLARDYAGRTFKLAEEEDRFAWERTTDALYQRYIAESVAAFPRFPALINKFDDQGWWKVKMPQPATFDGDLSRLAGELKDYGIQIRDKDEEQRVRRFHQRRSLTLERPENLARLQLDTRGQAAMQDRLDALLAKTDPDYMRKYPESAFDRAQLRACVLDLDGSTKIIVGLRATNPGDPAWLRQLAELTETNARLKALVEQRASSKPAREMIMLTLPKWSFQHPNVERLEEDLRGSFTPAGALTERGAWDLTRARQIHGSTGVYGMVLIGNHAVWNLEQQPWTGPRRDPMRADELRFFQDRPRHGDRLPFALVIADGVPRRDVRARFRLTFGAPPVDFRPDSPRKYEQAAVPGPDVGRPTITFVFGVRDIERKVHKEDGDSSDAQLVPMRALGLRIEPDRARLVDITRAARPQRRGIEPPQLAVKSLGERALPPAAGATTMDVTVAVEGKRVKVSAGGESFELPLAEPETGFYGFLVEQAGYVSVSQLELAGSGGDR